MSAPSLTKFTSELRKKNVARPNLYYTEIVYPGSENGLADLVSMWCMSAQTPQVDILTNDGYLENGIRRKYAYDVEYQNLVLTFYLDQDYKIKKFFDDWNQKIVKNRRNFSYPNDYTADVLKLFILNQDDKSTYQYHFNRVYPKTIQSVDLSYANGNTFSTLSVEFVYENLTSVAINSGSGVSKSSKPEFNFGELQPKTALNQELRQDFINSFSTEFNLGDLQPKAIIERAKEAGRGFLNRFI